MEDETFNALRDVYRRHIEEATREIRTMSLEEAAEFLSVTEEQAERLAAGGFIEASREQDSWRFDRQSVMAYASRERIRDLKELIRQLPLRREQADRVNEVVDLTLALEYRRGENAGSLSMGKALTEEAIPQIVAQVIEVTAARVVERVKSAEPPSDE